VTRIVTSTAPLLSQYSPWDFDTITYELSLEYCLCLIHVILRIFPTKDCRFRLLSSNRISATIRVGKISIEIEEFGQRNLLHLSSENQSKISNSQTREAGVFASGKRHYSTGFERPNLSLSKFDDLLYDILSE
jgi:hypothetical protein